MEFISGKALFALLEDAELLTSEAEGVPIEYLKTILQKESELVSDLKSFFLPTFQSLYAECYAEFKAAEPDDKNTIIKTLNNFAKYTIFPARLGSNLKLLHSFFVDVSEPDRQRAMVKAGLRFAYTRLVAPVNIEFQLASLARSDFVQSIWEHNTVNAQALNPELISRLVNSARLIPDACYAGAAIVDGKLHLDKKAEADWLTGMQPYLTLRRGWKEFHAKTENKV